MSFSPLRLATRKSRLALVQSEWVAARLREHGLEVELVLLTTEGDVTRGPLGEVGGQGLFTRRIQQALLDADADLAVHSLKDLPTEPVAGLALAAVPPRESPLDVLVSTAATSLEELPRKARVGTGSPRRKAQLLHRRPDLTILDVRGNVDTRLQRLAGGEYDALILAEAGLSRLGLRENIRQVIPAGLMLPAVGQGALGIEVRSDDEQARSAVSRLNDPATAAAVKAERHLLLRLRAGCLAPVGALGRSDSGSLSLDAAVLSPDGKQRLAASSSGSPEEPEQIADRVAEELLAQGAASLIAASHSA